MKKTKLLALVLALALVLCMVATLIACGDKNDSSADGDNAVVNDGAGTNTGDNNTGTNTGDNNTGTDTNTGDGGNTDNTTEHQTGAMKTREQITASLGSLYYIKARAINGTGVTEVATDGTYTYKTRPTPVFSIKIGEKNYTYTDLRDGKWHEMASPTVGGDALGTGNVGNIFLYAGETITYNTMETTTYLNRPVTKYTYASDNAYGYDISYQEEIIIDNATGACLKHVAEGRGHSSGNAPVSFEVTVFEYGASNTVATTFINEQKAKIDVYAWDTRFLAQAGLNVNGLQTPAGDLWTAEWLGNSSRDSENAEWNVIYYLYADEQTTDQRLAFRTFLQSFYDAGATRNDSGNVSAFNQLFGESVEEDEDWSFSFDAHTEDYEVRIYIDYNSHMVNKYWDIDITVEKH